MGNGECLSVLSEMVVVGLSCVENGGCCGAKAGVGRVISLGVWVCVCVRRVCLLMRTREQRDKSRWARRTERNGVGTPCGGWRGRGRGGVWALAGPVSDVTGGGKCAEEDGRWVGCSGSRTS